MEGLLSLLGRDNSLFSSDIEKNQGELTQIVSNSTFLVLGGAGTIGQGVVKEIFNRNPVRLHVVDISENNLAELVRDLRSSKGYIKGEFKTFAIDIASLEYDLLIESNEGYDYILNLSAIKHVRSEKDIFTLMRMIDVNILNTDKTVKQSIDNGCKKYFCVSTDKATNPVNMMGASKRIMEMFLMRRSVDIDISTARFANVAFSDGSLLHSFNQRLAKIQPLVAPNDVKRYFLTQQEAAELCLLSALLGRNRDVYFPKLSKKLDLFSFSEIAVKFLEINGFQPFICESEEQARQLMNTLPQQGKWPCFWTKSDTTGEKPFEEFYSKDESISLDYFQSIGVITNQFVSQEKLLSNFEREIAKFKIQRSWNKENIVQLFQQMLPEFNYLELGKHLDSKM